MRLVRVERCFQSVFTGTSLHGGELRGGKTLAIPMEIIVQTLNLVPFDPASVEYGLGTNAEPRENPPLRAALGNGRRLVVKPGSAGTGTAGIMKKRNFEDSDQGF